MESIGTAFGNISLGGFLFLLAIGAIIGGIVYIKARRSGRSINLKNLKSPFKKEDSDSAECLNIYPDCIKVETMLKKSISSDADMWQFGTKKFYIQCYINGKYTGFKLPDTISYPPERLARMMGCQPLRRLKSLKFGLLEQLAPFAPVVALGIGALLFIIVV